MYIVKDTNGTLRLYSTATSDQLPVVQGTSELNLPSDCSISSLELLTSDQSWVTISHSGFELIREGEETFVQVCVMLSCSEMEMSFHALLYCFVNEHLAKGSVPVIHLSADHTSLLPCRSVETSHSLLAT